MDMYQEELLEQYRSPQNKGSFSSEKNDVKIVKNINVGCGDEVKVELLFDESQTKINDIRWEGQGCVISMASMSVVSEYVKGKSIAEVIKLNTHDLLDMLGMKTIAITREKCLLLSLRTIQRAIKS